MWSALVSRGANVGGGVVIFSNSVAVPVDTKISDKNYCKTYFPTCLGETCRKFKKLKFSCSSNMGN